MRNLLTMLAVLGSILSSSAQAGSFIELGVGYNRNVTGCSECWDDGGANAFGAYGRVGYDWHVAGNTTVGAHWVHLSQWFEGAPVNQDNESSVDHIGVYVRWEL